MALNFTPEQQKVIQLHNRNLLVSAAAGSGKTAVLVERICQMVMQEGIDIDQILVVTFTKAAAAEMKSRVMKALEGYLRDDPNNVHLQRQITLIHHSMITTIDGFCLQFIKEHFYLLDLEPGFRMIDDNEKSLIMEDVIAEILNRQYDKGDADFVQFVESYTTGKSDDMLEEYIRKLYQAASSHPWPEKWLDNCKKGYDRESILTPEDIPLIKDVMTDSRRKIKEVIALLDKYQMQTAEYANLKKLSTDLHDRKEELQCLLNCGTYQQMHLFIKDYHFPTMPRCSKLDDLEKQVKDHAKQARDLAKELVKELYERYYAEDEQQMLSEHLAMGNMVAVLCDMTREFIQAFQQEKRQRNVVDFVDLEQFALSVLYDDDGGYSKVAYEYRHRYKEIMIDEYQDSNELQEAILTAISGDDCSAPNLFMVGDVKQSIYRFRQAQPELFIEKYNRYSYEDSKEQKIDLDANFRSRKQILDFSNYIFEGLMQEDLGGIVYDDHASLKYGAEYDRQLDELFATEILVGDQKQLKEQELSFDKEGYEAAMIAQAIDKIKQEGRLWDREKGSFRPVEYSDIVILLRSKKMSEPIAQELKTWDIPAIAIEKTGYFQAMEVLIMTSFLQVIDNDCQDIPLAAVLTSPLVGLSKAQLANIRVHDGKAPFYQTVREYCDNGTDQIIRDKLKDFYDTLFRYQQMASYLPIHELIKRIYEETGFYDHVCVMSQGQVRQQNLDILVQKARDYEESSYHGLFHFMRYIDKLKSYDMDLSEGAIVSHLNAVQIMTIHKSKGLEFPVVFLAGFGREFNKSDLRESLIIHPKYGIALKYVDPVRRITKDYATFEAMKNAVKLENLAEEIRVLYVAATRAKEKLIITGMVRDYEKLKASGEDALDESGKLYYMIKQKASHYLQWILPFAIEDRGHTKAQYCLQVFRDEMKPKQEASLESVMERSLYAEKVMHPLSTAEGQAQLAKMFSEQYHHQAELSLKNKMSVSEIKHHFMELAFAKVEDWEEEVPELSIVPPSLPVLPIELPIVLPTEETENPLSTFAGATKQVYQGALYGTAMHRAMECLDITMEWADHPTEDRVAKEIERLFLQGLISQEQQSLISSRAIAHFLQSELGRELIAAARSGRLKKEQPFVMGLSPKEAGISLDSQDIVLVQGIIDAFYEVKDGIVLLDYKTDRVSTAEELLARYQKQMELYQMAIVRGTNCKVVRSCMYSFALHQVVDLLI